MNNSMYINLNSWEISDNLDKNGIIETIKEDKRRSYGISFCSAGPNNKKCRRSRLLWTMRKDSGFEMMKRNSEFQENNLYVSSSYGKIESVSVENQFFRRV